MRYPWQSRLFWKLFAALWVSMIASFVCTFLVIYFVFQRRIAPPPGYVPLVPWLPVVTGAAVMIVVALVLAWYLSKPLKDLRWALRQVSEGHFDTRVQPRMGTRRDEIVDLAHEFDQMAERLQQVTDSRRVLLHDISHELRSPLTRMQAAIGLAKQAPAKTPEMLVRIENEAERLEELVGELLTLHRLEAGTRASRERVDVVELLHAIADDAHFEAQSTGRAVVITATQGFVADVNGELIYRAFENVIRNAVKFSPANERVEITANVDAADGLLTCHVLDRGPGVPADQLAAIFEPFAQAEGTETAGGYGLGLAIAKRAIEAHGGRITARLRDGAGLDVLMVLPRSEH